MGEFTQPSPYLSSQSTNVRVQCIIKDSFTEGLFDPKKLYYLTIKYY